MSRGTSSCLLVVYLLYKISKNDERGSEEVKGLMREE